jgi:hypothetical protein
MAAKKLCAVLSWRASTKIHATVDVLGNPTGFFLTGGKARGRLERSR